MVIVVVVVITIVVTVVIVVAVVVVTVVVAMVVIAVMAPVVVHPSVEPDAEPAEPELPVASRASWLPAVDGDGARHGLDDRFGLFVAGVGAGAGLARGRARSPTDIADAAGDERSTRPAAISIADRLFIHPPRWSVLLVPHNAR